MIGTRGVGRPLPVTSSAIFAPREEILQYVLRNRAPESRLICWSEIPRGH